MSIVERLRAANRHRTTGVYFVGYPKTGNTWTRFLLGRYLEQICGLDEPPLFDGYDRWGRCQRACRGPGMHFTHAPLEWESQTAEDLHRSNVVAPFRRSAVALIVRYPLDALVSLWMQQRHRTGDAYAGDLVAFARDPVFGLDKLIRFHELWAAEQGRRRGLHIIRYEDLRVDPAAGLRALLGFIGIPVDERAVAVAVERSSFGAMRKLEESGTAPRYRSSGADVFATGDRSNADAFHVRKGTVGGYRDHFDADAAREFEDAVRTRMPPLYGYAEPPVDQAHVA